MLKKDLSVKSGGNAEMQKKTLKSRTFQNDLCIGYLEMDFNALHFIDFAI